MLVSVIIPVHNVAPFLPECLDSILAQTVADFELLLIDDGSTDASGTICDRYAARDPRVRVFHTPNSGVSRARNFALDRARGEYVHFVDSDDRIAPERLERLLGTGVRENGIAFGGMAELDPTGRYVFPMPDRRAEGGYRACAPVLAELLRKGCFSWTWSKLFSRATIERHALRFEECLFAEDEIFTAAYCRHIDHIATDSRPTYFYRVRPGSLFHSPKTPEQLIGTEMQVFRRYVALGYDDEILHVKARMLLSRLKRMLRQREGELGDWRSELSQTAVTGLREVWKTYTRTFQWHYVRDSRDVQYTTLGRLIFTPKSDSWLKLMIRTLSI